MSHISKPANRTVVEHILHDLGITPVALDAGDRVHRLVLHDFADARRALQVLGRRWACVKIRRPGIYQGMFSLFR